MAIGKLTPYYHGKKQKRLDFIFTDEQGRFVVSVERNGKRRRKICDNLTAAQYWASNVNLLFKGTRPKPKVFTVADLLERYPPRTNVANATRSDKHIMKYFGKMDLQDLNREEVARYLDQRSNQYAQYAVTKLVDGVKTTVLKDKKPLRKIGAKTANDDIRRLHKILEQAREDRLISFNPIHKWKPLPEAPPRTRWLTHEEEARLKPHCDEEFWRLIEIALTSGMRQEEQFGCKRHQILWESNQIYLPKTKTRAARHIPMSARLRAAVKAQLDIGKVWLCPNESRSHRLSQKILYDKFNRAVKAAGIHDFTWHDLRHTFCSRLAMAGVSLRVIQELAGHARIETTERYAHLAAVHLYEAVEVFDLPHTNDETTPETTP